MKNKVMVSVLCLLFLISVVSWTQASAQTIRQDWDRYHQALGEAISEMDSSELPRRISPDPEALKEFANKEMIEIHKEWLSLGDWRSALKSREMNLDEFLEVRVALSGLYERAKQLVFAIPSNLSISGRPLEDEYNIALRMLQDLGKEKIRAAFGVKKFEEKI